MVKDEGVWGSLEYAATMIIRPSGSRNGRASLFAMNNDLVHTPQDAISHDNTYTHCTRIMLRHRPSLLPVVR